MQILFFLQQLPEVPTGDDKKLLGWIIGILLATVVGLVARYEKKLSEDKRDYREDLRDKDARIRTVITEHMNDLRKQETQQSEHERQVAELVNKLHQIMVVQNGI